MLPLTGSFSASGNYFQQAYQLATEEVNSAGGLDLGGKKLQVNLKILDDGRDATKSRSLVEQLATQEKVNAFLGGYDTVLVQSQQGVPDQYKIPMVEGGAGKTTTLRTISGLLPAVAGSVRFDGREITHARSDQIVELGIVHVPEGRQLWPRMSVQEKLELGAYLPRPKAQRAESLERVFALFPRLKERRRQVAGTLSGGERQMCALARGLMGLPRLLMLDEPSLGLAPRLVSEMFETLRTLCAQGLTVLLVEQNVHQALELAEVGYGLETGRVVLSGPSRELLANRQVESAYLGGGVGVPYTPHS